jgi:aspartate/methionine/tyrosine aminotransferase
MAGCRIGYVCGNRHVIKRLADLKSNLDYGVFAPIQHAATSALLNGDAFQEQNRKLYERRRNVFIDHVRSIGWKVATPPATMFVWAEIPEGFTSASFAKEILEKAEVVVTPGRAFGENGEGYVRIALVQSEDRLKEAALRIGRIL